MDEHLQESTTAGKVLRFTKQEKTFFTLFLHPIYIPFMNIYFYYNHITITKLNNDVG